MNMSSRSSSDSGSVVGIVAGCIGVSVVITLVTGDYTHWPFVLTGVAVGLWTVSTLSK